MVTSALPPPPSTSFVFRKVSRYALSRAPGAGGGGGAGGLVQRDLSEETPSSPAFCLSQACPVTHFSEVTESRFGKEIQAPRNGLEVIFQSHSSGLVKGKLLKEQVWKKIRKHREMGDGVGGRNWERFNKNSTYYLPVIQISNPSFTT